MKVSKLLIISTALFILAFYIFGIYCIGQTDTIHVVEHVLSVETKGDVNIPETVIEVVADSPVGTITNSDSTDTELKNETDTEINMITVLIPPSFSDSTGGVDLELLIDTTQATTTTTASSTTASKKTSTTTASTTSTKSTVATTTSKATNTTTQEPTTTTEKATSTTSKTSASKTTSTKKATTTTTTAKTTTTTTTTTTAKKTTTTTTTKATTTTTTQAKSGWTGTFTVKNNLSSSKTYGQNVTDDAFTIVCRNVEAEMGSSYHPEALKAQAIAAYSFIKTQRNIPSLPLADKVSDAVRNACASVNGYAAYYNGNFAQTIYCASSGGYTANASEVWGGYYPYLVSVPCPVDAQYDKNYGVCNVFSSSEIAERIKNATGIVLTGNPDEWFTLTRSSSGYVSYVDIMGKGKITGQQFRANVMSYKIKSHNMTIAYNASTDSFTITTYGYGHGVGMSQNGAHYYAKYYGWNYQQILYHFYTGITLKKVG